MPSPNHISESLLVLGHLALEHADLGGLIGRISGRF